MIKAFEFLAIWWSASAHVARGAAEGLGYMGQEAMKWRGLEMHV